MTLPTNEAFLKLSKRAETSARDTLVHTFVDVGPLFNLLSSRDHQIVFGRRGTGKTHAFAYLAGDRDKAGDAVVSIDLRNVGSNAGLYGDGTRPLAERSTGLLVDVLSAIHEALYHFFVGKAEAMNLAEVGPALDALADAITQVRVAGAIEREIRTEASAQSENRDSAKLSGGPDGVSASLGDSRSTSTTTTGSARTTESGEARLYVNFGTTGAAFRRIAALLGAHRLWLLLDEWSSVPIVLQPYLADLLRRSVFPVQGITVKIAAIEQRSEFQSRHGDGDYLGIEVGADASADISLDDFMVFDNDEEKATAFFRRLINRHTQAVVEGTDLAKVVPSSEAELMKAAFTEKRAIEDFVRASEGVPRDAINILALAAQRAVDDQLSVQHVRVAAKLWYQRDKDRVVSSNDPAKRLLHWIIDVVIGKRRARAFLLRAHLSDALIDALYDARVLHVLKRGVSTHDQPGVRYDVYKLDYGCYVDLITTAKAPMGLLPAESDAGSYVDVPPDDYRSIRRAILELEEFYAAEPEEQR